MGCRVAEPWAQSYENLPSVGRAVLRGLAVLDLRSILGADLPAASGGGQVTDREMDTLIDDGWLIFTESGEWQVPSKPGVWLAHLARHVDALRALNHVTRFAEHLLRVLDAGTEPLVRVDRNRGRAIVATVRAAGRHRRITLATTLAATTWRRMAPSIDRTWWHALAEASEGVAIEAREPSVLVVLLHESGAAFARAGDSFVADRQWRRAFALTEQLGGHERSAALLKLIGDLRRANGSFGRALTIFHELVKLREDLGDQLGLADALAELATTMMCARRGSDAKYYLRRAAETLPLGEDLPPQARIERANALVKIGQGWDRQGSYAAAMSCYSRALAELVDLDDEIAAKARALLAAAARARAGKPKVATRGRGSATRRGAE